MIIKPRFLISAVILLGLFAVGILFLVAHSRSKRDMQPFNNGPSADVSWVPKGKPMEIVCTVYDTNSRPVSDVSLNFFNNSGGNRATTDQFGTAKLSVGEREVERITVNGHSVLERPRAYNLNYPTVQSGLLVRIIIKGPKILKKSVPLGE